VKLPALVVATLVAAATGAIAEQGGSWSFDDLAAGGPPPGFVFHSAMNEQTQTGRWTVQRDGGNGLLAFTRQGRPAVQLAVVETATLDNLSISTRLRFEGHGRAGLAWRYRDANTYYAVALDLQAHDVRIYRVAGGNRTRLEDEDDLELDPGAWHVLKVEHQETRMRVWINGVPVTSARDRRLPEPGAIGLWADSDSAVWFDDLRAEPMRPLERGDSRD
jgi:hypothetical protein